MWLLNAYSVRYEGHGQLRVYEDGEAPQFLARDLYERKGILSEDDTVLVTDWIPGYGSIEFRKSAWKGPAIYDRKDWHCEGISRWLQTLSAAEAQHFLGT